MKLTYCSRCILPCTRPNLKFDASGKCNCATSEEKDAIDWASREAMFREVVKSAKVRSQGYDCLVPVSGGKDSTWQVAKCLEYGLKPLAVTWRPPGRTPLGQRNLDNLIGLGVDHIDYSISPEVEKKFTYQALVKYGSTAIPMHMAIFSIPLRLAVKFRIPLVIWGENSAFEYGGTEEERTGFKLDSAWLKKFGVTHGTRAEDWVSETLTKQELTPYFLPSDEEMNAAGVKAVFLGYYFKWDPVETARVAAKHGFKADSKGPRTGYYDFADIDDYFISIHHYLKWYKFGFTRTYDNLSIEIRNGRLSREKAIEILKKLGDETPHGDIEKLCEFLGITKAHFFEIAETFRNHDIWTKENGKWKIRDFLIPDWSW